MTKFKEMFTEAFEVIFPLFDKSESEMHKIGKKHNLVVKSTWDSMNPDDFTIMGKPGNIKKFLKEVGFESYINQI